jgi:saccharopepsin
MDVQAQHLGQKYMGIRPDDHAEHMFKYQTVHTEGHPVPVSNFVNAQCKSLIRGPPPDFRKC